MSADWYIPMRVGLPRDKKVLAISAKTGRSRHEVAGLLLDFWGWVTLESRDGHVPSVTKKVLCEAIGGDEAFWTAVEAVGWIFITPEEISVPDFDEWLGKVARVRLQANLRQQERRAKKKEEENGHALVTPPSRSKRDKKATRHRDDMDRDTSSPPTPPKGETGGGGKEKTDDEIAGEVLREARVIGEQRTKDFVRAGEEFKAAIEAAWTLYRELLVTRRTGKQKIQDLDAYVTKIRREHRHPREVMPEIDQELERRRAARERQELLERIIPFAGRLYTTPAGRQFKIEVEGLSNGRDRLPWSGIKLEDLRRIAQGTAKAGPGGEQGGGMVAGVKGDREVAAAGRGGPTG
jgi:hypothetical protein